MTAFTLNKKFELPDWSHSVSDIQEVFEYIIKKQEMFADNLSIRKFVNKKEHKVTFRVKTVYYIQLLTPTTMKLFGSTKTTITLDKNGENVPHLEITKVVLVHCNIVNNDYQKDFKDIKDIILIIG